MMTTKERQAIKPKNEWTTPPSTREPPQALRSFTYYNSSTASSTDPRVCAKALGLTQYGNDSRKQRLGLLRKRVKRRARSLCHSPWRSSLPCRCCCCHPALDMKNPLPFRACSTACLLPWSVLPWLRWWRQTPSSCTTGRNIAACIHSEDKYTS